MKDVMLDLETFGTGKDACICQIGACYFNRQTAEIGKTFKVNIDARTSVKAGAVIDADTVYWWLSQSPEAVKSITEGPLQDIRLAILDLNLFMIDAKYVWSHSTFDFVILSNVFKQLDIRPNFRYTSSRDIRTLTDLSGLNKNDYKKLVREGVHHDALDDCKFQVKYCVEAFKELSKL